MTAPCHLLLTSSVLFPGLVLFHPRKSLRLKSSVCWRRTSKRLCHSDTIVTGGLRFSIPFTDLCLVVRSLWGYETTRSIMLSMRETPSHKKKRCPFDVPSYFFGRGECFESVVPEENAAGVSTSSAESLGRSQYMAHARNRTGFFPHLPAPGRACKGLSARVGSGREQAGRGSVTSVLSLWLVNSTLS